MQPQEIKALREQLRLSQPVFARYLNTSVSTVQKWETGVKRPCGVSPAAFDRTQTWASGLVVVTVLVVTILTFTSLPLSL